jgi:hypothetical protein
MVEEFLIGFIAGAVCCYYRKEIIKELTKKREGEKDESKQARDLCNAVDGTNNKGNHSARL